MAEDLEPEFEKQENDAISPLETPVESAVDESADKPISTREALTDALKKSKEKGDNEATASKAPKKDKSISPPAVKDVGTKTAAPAASQSPQAWSAAAREEFPKLPPLIQQEVLRREETVAKKIAEQDADRQLGQSMKETISPYMHIITSEGGTPVTAVKELLNSAHLLRTGTQQQKLDLILNTAKRFGVNLGISPQQSGQSNNELHAANQKIAQLEQRLNQWESTERQKGEATIQSKIQAFASDPKHPHFQQVAAHMAALIDGGVAKDLDDAYEQAVWARPELRSTLLAAQDEQRRSADTAKIQAARKAGSSVVGSPGRAASAPPNKNMSTRDAIKAAIAESRGS